MTLSIILPLYDLRNALERPLASLLSQRLERTKYEVIVVVPACHAHAFLGREPFRSLLARCDQIVSVDVDPDAPESEIAFYSAGSDKATGDLLFFIEGHTTILPDACRAIYDHFNANPGCLAAWGLRLNHNDTTLGKLLGMHNDRHENVARARGWFTFGGNSVVRKSVFVDLGGLEPAYGRFNESIIFEKLTQRGVSVQRLDVPISLHYNDMSVAHLMELTVAMGRWKARYRLLNGDREATDQRLASHTLAWLVRGRALARVCLPAFTAAGLTLLQMARVLYGVSHRLAYRLFVSALGFFDLAGYTQVRVHGLES